MTYEEILRELASLPPEDREQVADFIVTLRQRHSLSSSENASLVPTSQPFVGMWSDREDMLDSSAWVRQHRQLEWVK